MLVVAAFLPGISAGMVLAPIAAIGPGALIAIVFTVAGSFARSFAFRLAESPDGLRVRAGLTETRSATVPPGRVQAVLVSQSWLWRRFDWWHVKVNIAGYAQQQDGQESSSAVLLPVGTRADVRALLALVVPAGPDGGAGRASTRPCSRPGCPARTATAASSPRPRAARWLDPFAWRRNGYAVTDRVLLARTGLLDRHLVVVPHERTQSVGLYQGPLQRRLGLVSVRLHSTPGPVSPARAAPVRGRGGPPARRAGRPRPRGPGRVGPRALDAARLSSGGWSRRGPRARRRRRG